MIDGGRKLGFRTSATASPKTVREQKAGAATKVHPAVLRDAVVTPGGTTIAAIHELERHGLRAMLISAVETATARSKAIGAQIVEQFSKNMPPTGAPKSANVPGKAKPKKRSAPPRKRGR